MRKHKIRSAHKLTEPKWTTTTTRTRPKTERKWINPTPNEPQEPLNKDNNGTKYRTT